MIPRTITRRSTILMGTTLMLLLLTLLFGSHLIPAYAHKSKDVIPSKIKEKDNSNSLISRENARKGTEDWKIPVNKIAGNELQAYDSTRSIAPGHDITFFVSTKEEGIQYSIQIFRLGWYHGKGGRLMFTSPTLHGQVQGYFDKQAFQLVNCNSCTLDKNTRLVEANWQPSYTLTIPNNWVTGVYLAKFIDEHGQQTYASFDVLGNYYSDYVVVTADTTYAAYNNWGGHSLYDYNSNGRASKVSFNRPSTQNAGSDQVLIYEADALRWFERRGYNLSYMSSVDLHSDPDLLMHHKAYISLGHDEYWSKEMRDGVEDARDHGVGLAFMQANAAYWQVRFEPDSQGNDNRTIVCYKVLTTDGDLSNDPLYGTDNSRVTSQWRDPVVDRPENALIGIMYSDLSSGPHGFPWRVDPQAKSPLLAGSNFKRGQSYGCSVVGYEWDRVFDNGETPEGLHIIGTSPTVSSDNEDDVSNTSYYVAPSGALVFATGSIYWSAALDTYRYNVDADCPNPPQEIPQMQRLMKNVMDALIVRY